MSRWTPPILAARRAAPLALLLVALASPALAEEAPAQGPRLVQAKVLFQGLEYEKCLALLADAPATSPEAALYRGLCLHGLGREQAATEAFRQAHAQDPRLLPPSFCSPKVLAFFANAVGVPLSEVEAGASGAASSPPTDVQAAGPLKPVLVPSPLVGSPHAPPPPAAAHVARLPVVTLVLAGVAVAGLGTGVSFGARSSDAVRHGRDAVFESTWARSRDEAVRDARVANTSFAVAAVSAVAAGVSAWLLRPSDVPPAETAAPPQARHPAH